MDAVRKEIISRLEREILPLEGLKSLATDNHINLGFRPIEASFPNAIFPVGCIHEFLSSSKQNLAATNGFIASLLSKLMQFKGASIWISASRTLFPAALQQFGAEPHQIIFIDLKKEKDVMYAVEEALKCTRIAAVIGELKDITFKESRRLQLAAEQSRVTGFLVRHQPKIVNTIACVSRWRITSSRSELADGLPGVGFPRWNVELLKVRNGKPGIWQLEWQYNHLHEIRKNIASISQEEVRKTG
ncbi:MAG: Error-prone repair protein ImuA [Bacteroidetes bacterium]|nr:MAG: Error-prone repair protein ImuA [Bacteroidota bacterium]